VSENYPQLKSDALFRDLTAQLEGTENRNHRRPQPLHQVGAGVQHDRAAVPTNLTAMLFKMDVKPNFTVENEAAISAPPKVDFDKHRRVPRPRAGGAAPRQRLRRPRRARPEIRRPAGDAAGDLLKKGY